MRRYTKTVKKRSLKNKPCTFCTQKTEPDYKEVEVLNKFLSERGKIIPRAISGVCQKHQRRLTRGIKRSRFLALLPFIVRPT